MKRIGKSIVVVKDPDALMTLLLDLSDETRRPIVQHLQVVAVQRVISDAILIGSQFPDDYVRDEMERMDKDLLDGLGRYIEVREDELIA